MRSLGKFRHCMDSDCAAVLSENRLRMGFAGTPPTIEVPRVNTPNVIESKEEQGGVCRYRRQALYTPLLLLNLLIFNFKLPFVSSITAEKSPKT